MKLKNRLLTVSGIAMLVLTLLVMSLPSAAMADSSRTYTLDADFAEGILVNVNYTDVPDQLQLNEAATTYPVMWIANGGEDSVSKWDTNNNKELARYHTWFGSLGDHGSWAGASPSRTCVDAEGNCYVANRHFDGLPADVIKIFANEWIDRNGNGVLDTSTDINGNGTIEPGEMLPMTDTNGNNIIDDIEILDERIAWAVTIGPAGGLGRSLAIDPNGNIWLGLFNAKEYYKLSSADGSILAGPIDVTGAPLNPFDDHTPYGALVDKYGIGLSLSLDYLLHVVFGVFVPRTPLVMS